MREGEAGVAIPSLGCRLTLASEAEREEWLEALQHCAEWWDRQTAVVERVTSRYPIARKLIGVSIPV